MRVLGIDYGTKRIGLALSDEGSKIAFPKEVIENSPEALKAITSLAKQSGVETIVIGESKDFGGRENPIMTSIRKMKKAFEDDGFTVFLEPEFSSSFEAERFQGAGNMHDASAAAIILQRFLEKQQEN